MIKLIKFLSNLKACTYSIRKFFSKFKIKKAQCNPPSFDLLRNYGYELSSKLNSCVDLNGCPIAWYTYPSLEYLNQFDYSAKRIFEYGCGNSSLYWASRAKEVISVDDNKEWYEKLCKRKPNNLSVLLEEDLDIYAKSIEKYGKFDVIVIDGYVRDKCCESAIKHLNEGGFIILDNSDRCPDFEEYSQAVKILKMNDLIQVDFYGFGPLNEYTWCTSLFLTKNVSFETKSEFQPTRGINGIKGR